MNAKNNTDFNTKYAFMSHQPQYIAVIRLEKRNIWCVSMDKVQP